MLGHNILSVSLFDLSITIRFKASHVTSVATAYVISRNDSTSFLKRGSHNDEAGENCGKADQRVNDGVDLQYHIRAPSVSC